ETQLKAKETGHATVDAMVEPLREQRRIERRNLGVFEVKGRKPRKARIRRTGERVDVEAKYVVTFKPGKEMEDKVRNLGEPQLAGSAVGDSGADSNGRKSKKS